MIPKAIITGITGQTGSYLAEILLGKGYEVHGMVRRASSFNRSRIEHLRADPGIYERRLFLHYADLTDATTLRRVIARVGPTEFYHLAGQSHVGLSFEIPESTMAETAGATLTLLEICRDLPQPPRFYHASSSEIFGNGSLVPQTEESPYRPITPYGCAKVFATDIGRVYRDVHGLFVCNGITYNHESIRRGENFVTRKITSSAIRIAGGSQEILELGNLDSARDWGYAPEYAEAMWQMLQAGEADDYIMATGQLTSVRDFACAAFVAVGLDLDFEGSGDSEQAHLRGTNRTVLRVNPKFFRAADPNHLVGDASKIERQLGWRASTAGAAVARAIVSEGQALQHSTQGRSSREI